MILTAKTREITGKKVKSLRKQGLVPGVVYGHKLENKNIMVKESELMQVYEKAGDSSLIELKIDDEPSVKTLFQDTILDISGQHLIHFDLHQVNMKEKITAEVEIVFIGESPIIKEVGGTLIKNIDALSIECLPGDLISEIKIDVSGLDSFEKKILVKDLSVPKNIKVLNNADDVVAMVAEVSIEKEPVPQAESKPEEAKIAGEEVGAGKVEEKEE